MLTVTKEQKGNALHVTFSGTIEENVNFGSLIGPAPAELFITLKDVPRINSVGVKTWIKYFESVKANGTKITYVGCSSAIVEQINLISNFTCGGTVESIYAPYSCTVCKCELLSLFKIEDLKKLNFEMPESKCVKCGGKAIFDDIPEEYLSFFVR
ncbi:MAG: hypothetical protein AABZ55_14310 [Bdellovibrionota bacterium]|mgnify:CR=1 FL=1